MPELGEYIRGHAGRLSLWNGFLSAEELLLFLNGGARGRERDPVYRLMASLSGLDPVSYLKANSLLPFCCVGTRSDDVFDYESPGSLTQRTAWRQLKEGAYLCSSCVAKDEGTLGYSYWRAFHQLPGIDTCPTHATALGVVEDIGAFDLPPAFWAATAQPVYDELVSLRTMPVVARYAEIAHAFMTAGRRVSGVVAARCVGPRAAAMSFPIGTHIARSTLAHCVRDAFPSVWLDAHYPKLSGSVDCSRVQSVNGLCGGSVVSGVVYAMALAATFSTSEEAIQAFYATPSSRTLKRSPAWRAGALPEHRERILPYYNASEGIVTRVAEMLGFEKMTAFSRLRAVGLPPLGRLPKSDRQLVIAFLSKASKTEVDRWIAAGSSVSEICSTESRRGRRMQRCRGAGD